MVDWLVGCVLRPIDSEVIERWYPHLMSLAKDVELGFYTVPTGNRTLGRRVAVHYTTAAPRHRPRAHYDSHCMVGCMISHLIGNISIYALRWNDVEYSF